MKEGKKEEEESKEGVPTIESFHGKERHEKQSQLYNNSHQQQQCDSFKQYIFPTCSPKDSTTTITIYKVIQLMNTSPRDLMSMLQQQQQWKPRTRDIAVQEILRERREAIETGKLKGRRLFEPIQRGGGTTILLNDVLSGDDHMGQESEVMSLCFDYSDDETYSPSSFPHFSCDSTDKDQEVKEEEETHDVCNAEARVGHGGRYIIFMGVIAIALLIFAIYKSWVRRFEEHHKVILVPT